MNDDLDRRDGETLPDYIARLRAMPTLASDFQQIRRAKLLAAMKTQLRREESNRKCQEGLLRPKETTPQLGNVLARRKKEAPAEEPEGARYVEIVITRAKGPTELRAERRLKELRARAKALGMRPSQAVCWAVANLTDPERDELRVGALADVFGDVLEAVVERYGATD
jgi:hypothetical protein